MLFYTYHNNLIDHKCIYEYIYIRRQTLNALQNILNKQIKIDYFNIYILVLI